MSLDPVARVEQSQVTPGFQCQCHYQPVLGQGQGTHSSKPQFPEEERKKERERVKKETVPLSSVINPV